MHMSIPVAIDALEAKTQEYDYAYLLTVNDDQTPKIVAVRPVWDGATITIDEGGRSARNSAARSTVTISYPPLDPTGYTLIIDGTASVDTAGEAVTISVAPTGAVLHRPAPAGFEAAADGCGHDCAPIDS
ncbi:hypothetical protein YM304_34260 [Ilumatobacter coccineus YM16-304]|uniref:Pyridoxamine 5'-phosphate oxidase putative domain-containing protein n=2 Tax=Ilumatobacter coccineus TaxID=467094 RepID=A0A6C7EBI3_ILUCY|nr:hypothetical protein YM304_34260 [Ilumatobacter coccineus YM16-304]